MGLKTPEQMRVSIDARLAARVDPARGRDINRVRTLLLMERFLARVRHVMPATTVLKGGLALELRLDAPRTTQDLDLRALGDPADLGRLLGGIVAWRPDPEDHVEFAIRPDPHHPTITGEGVKYDGFRFKVVGRLAGRDYVHFGLDIAYGDPIHGDPVLVTGSDFFEKYGIPPVEVAVYPAASHLAEKVHAYTLPRDRVNMRLKDLVDLPLLGHLLDRAVAGEVRQALVTTFAFRDSHPLPTSLPAPPVEWLGPYDRLVREEAMAWPTLTDLHRAAAALVDPVLAGIGGTWSDVEGRWNPV